MDLVRNNLTYLGLVLLASVIPVLVVVDTGFPYLGISLTLVILSSLIFSHKPEKSKFTKISFGLSLLLAFFVVLRAQPFLTGSNILACLTVIAALTLERPKNKYESLVIYFGSGLTLLIRTVMSKSKYRLKSDSLSLTKIEVSPAKTKQVIISIIISCLLLVIILPMLIFANPFFGQKVTNLIRLLDAGLILDYLVKAEVGIWSLRILLFGLLFLFLPRLLTVVGHDNLPILTQKTKYFNLTIPKIVVLLVLSLFFISQVQLYTASTEALLEVGYTHSTLSREVFTQLSLVSLILFGLVYYDKNQQGTAKKLNYLLLAGGVILCLLASKSVVDYIQENGFTFSRLWGLATIIWIVGIYLVTWFLVVKKKTGTLLSQSLFIFSIIVLIGVNLANFDYLVYHVNPPRVNQVVDQQYLAWNVSTDANAYHLIIEQFDSQLNEGLAKGDYYENVEWPYYISVDNSQRIIRKFQNLDIRTFNIAEYQQYQSIKGLEYFE